MHDSEGSLGLVINRKHHFELGSLITCDFPHQGFYFGGPVEENSLACLHQQGSSVEGALPFSDELSLNLDVGLCWERLATRFSSRGRFDFLWDTPAGPPDNLRRKSGQVHGSSRVEMKI